MANLLVIDDSRAMRELIEKTMTGVVDKVLRAMDGTEGISLAKMLKPDVILLDRHLPDMDGLEVMARLKQNIRTRDIPVIFLTADDSDESLSEALDAGAMDYITKPFSKMQLVARVNTAIRTARIMDQLRNAAQVDPLTGLKNRMTYDDAVDRAFDCLKLEQESFAIILLDLDHFKQVNDTHGHIVGDEVLARVGKCLNALCRSKSEAFRYGGEEFLILLHNPDQSSAEVMADKVLHAIREIQLIHDDQVIPVTVSAGLVMINTWSDQISPHTVINTADDALYTAKRGGRDRVVIGELNQASYR